MSWLTKKLAGAYDSVPCVKPDSIKYCPDNTVGTQPMLDFSTNRISVDTPIFNDISDGFDIGYEIIPVNDMFDFFDLEKEVDIINLAIKHGRKG